MKVLHFTFGSVDPSSQNGINRVIEGLAQASNRAGSATVDVLTVRSKLRDKRRELVARDRFEVQTCADQREALAYLKETGRAYDIVHLHNAWNVENCRIAKWAERTGTPYVVTPHAAFLPDRMERRSVAKQMFHRVLQKRMLDRAAFLHAVSRDEMSSIAAFSSNRNIVFVPNGSAAPRPRSRGVLHPLSTLRIGYIGRLAREKNLLGLIEAVSLLSDSVRSQVELYVYGACEGAYASECLARVARLGLAKCITFAGHVSADEKWKRLQELDAYIQPSFSEAASISLLEALSQALPIIATRTSGVSYWQGQEFLQMTEPVPVDLARGISALVQGRALLRDQGAAALQFYDQHFKWERISEQMNAHYQDAVSRARSLKVASVEAVE